MISRSVAISCLFLAFFLYFSIKPCVVQHTVVRIVATQPHVDAATIVDLSIMYCGRLFCQSPHSSIGPDWNLELTKIS